MEITIDRRTLYPSLALATLLISLGLAVLGRPYSPESVTGDAQVIRWSDWQRIKAERRFETERATLRQDVDQLAALLNGSPDPVTAQLLAERIERHASAGEAILEMARASLLQAARDVTSWSAGTLDREAAIASLQAAATLLK